MGVVVLFSYSLLNKPNHEKECTNSCSSSHVEQGFAGGYEQVEDCGEG